MSLYSTLPIYNSVKKLSAGLIMVSRNIARNYVPISAKCIELSVNLLSLITRANRTTDPMRRTQVLNEFMISYDTLESLILLSAETGVIGKRALSRLCDLMASIAKQGTAWKNETLKRAVVNGDESGTAQEGPCSLENDEP